METDNLKATLEREFLEGLNDVQREAVLHDGGPLLILAGAGSGKTRVITHRIAHLIRVRDVPSRRILAVTFTNKAAAEMRERTEALVGPYGRDAMIRTFHSLGLQILRENAPLLGLKSSFTVYDPAAQKSLAKKILKDLKVEAALLPPEAALNATERARERLLDPDSYAAETRKDPYHQSIAQFYREYHKRLREQQALDFSDLLYETVMLLQTNAQLLEMCRRRWQHLLVDEYQDTNHAQYRLVLLLAGGHRNVVVVGDDDQSIYSWRGADISNILNFEKDFPEAKVLRLEENYRSTPSILKLAASVIQNNSERREKTLFTNRPDARPPSFRLYQEEGEEARSVLSRIRELRSAGVRLNEIAVFYRTNAQSRIFEQVFREANLPHTVFGGFRFFDRKEIRDLMAYMQVLVNPLDVENFERVLANPPKGIGEKTLESARFLAGTTGIPYLEALRQLAVKPGFRGAKPINAFLANYERWTDLNESGERPSVILKTLIEESGIVEYYRKEDDPESVSRIENMQEFATALADYEDRAGAENREVDIAEFLQSVSLYSSESDPDLEEEDRQGVHLMTLHNAKGLEFRVVFFTGLEESLLPHRMSLEEGNLEEERRLVYVGITRAMEQLYLSACRFRRTGGSFDPRLPSRFLEEMGIQTRRERSYDEFDSSWSDSSRSYSERKVVSRPAPDSGSSALNLVAGDRVRHKSFGTGEIENTEKTPAGTKLTIRFDDGTTRRFLDRYTPLERI